jgi:hypothetical protein
MSGLRTGSVRPLPTPTLLVPYLDIPSAVSGPGYSIWFFSEGPGNLTGPEANLHNVTVSTGE